MLKCGRCLCTLSFKGGCSGVSTANSSPGQGTLSPWAIVLRQGWEISCSIQKGRQQIFAEQPLGCARSRCGH